VRHWNDERFGVEEEDVCDYSEKRVFEWVFRAGKMIL